MRSAQATELTDLPRCDPNLSSATILKKSTDLSVIYEAAGPDWPDTESWAVIRFTKCACVLSGGPNEEALHNHPLYPAGLKWCTLHEILNSPWLAQRCAIQDKDANPHPHWWIGQCRHFILAFKENTVEVMAERYELVGIHDSPTAATHAALARIGAQT